jgi:hypothetical protein
MQRIDRAPKQAMRCPSVQLPKRSPGTLAARRFREATHGRQERLYLHDTIQFHASLEPAEIQRYDLLHLPNSTTVVLSVWWLLTSWRGKWHDFETAGPGLCGLLEPRSMLPCLRSSCKETSRCRWLATILLCIQTNNELPAVRHDI